MADRVRSCLRRKISGLSPKCAGYGKGVVINMKNTLNGYMTVEAALLMPMVWFSMFFMIFAGFFLYDRCIAEQDSKMIVMRASEERESDEARVIRKVMEKGDLAGKKKLLFSRDVQKEFNISGDKAKMKISGRVNTILSRLVRKSDLGVFAYSAEYEAERNDPVGFIRACRRVEKYAGD